MWGRVREFFLIPCLDTYIKFTTNDHFRLRYDGVYTFDTQTFIPRWISDEGDTLFLNFFIDRTGVTGERWIFNTEGKGVLVSEREVTHEFVDGESRWILYDPNTLQIIGGAYCFDRNSFYCSHEYRPTISPSLNLHPSGIFHHQTQNRGL